MGVTRGTRGGDMAQTSQTPTQTSSSSHGQVDDHNNTVLIYTTGSSENVQYKREHVYNLGADPVEGIAIFSTRSSI